MSKSCISMFNDNINNEFIGYSERTSIIDQNGDNNNNNYHTDCTFDDGGSNKSIENGKFNFHKIRRFLKRRMASIKFKNIQIEMLYQRYLLRMNQNNAAHIVWLLFALIFILAIIHINFFINRWNFNEKCRANNETTTIIESLIDGNFTVIDFNETTATMTTTATAMTMSLLNELNASSSYDINTITMSNANDECEKMTSNTYELLGTNLIQFMLLGLCSILYTILLLCLYKQRINEIYLFHVSYAIIISLVIIDISFSITNMGR